MTPDDKIRLSRATTMIREVEKLLHEVCYFEEEYFKAQSQEFQDSEEGCKLQYAIDDVDDAAANLRDIRKMIAKKLDEPHDNDA